MRIQVIPLLACIMAGYVIYEAKAEDFIDSSRISRLSAIGERQGPFGTMDLNFDNNGLSGGLWDLDLHLHKDDAITLDTVLLNDRFPGNSNRGPGPWRGLEGFNLFTNRPGDSKVDIYSMILDAPAMYTIPPFAEGGFGLEVRKAMIELGGPRAYDNSRAQRPSETVPEPMVIGLFAISGIGLLFARRMFRKF